ncbi:COP9 signalosome complex subunit 6a [Apostasia shenzhenica]|uniref:COP9 signalosome complex subunit 6a n=1 Tax=Apostasia shenzhenica TaxID=1088818 RepID=A0A2I0AN23_9ASPA|nr:COP9 signalosome complex subunit 6a [Apostasia shenzhenica]
MSGGIPQLISVRSNYAMEIIEAEIISVAPVAHLNRSDGGTITTQLAAHPTSIHNAIKMLNKRIRIVHQHLLALQRGDVPLEYSVLRRVSNQRLPTIKSEKFQDDFVMEFNDTLLTTDLAMFMNSMSTLDELIGKFNINYNCIHKVFDLSRTKPSDFVQHGLACWENLLDRDDCCAKLTCKNLRVMVASGDVTVCWVLGSFGELHQQNREPRPQAGIIPLSIAVTGQISHLDSWHVLLHKVSFTSQSHCLSFQSPRYY